MKSTFVAAIVALSPGLAEAQDWSGAYGALGSANVSGYEEWFRNGVPSGTWGNEGRLTSLAIGYNLQDGGVVYGAELGYSTGKITFAGLLPDNYLDGMVDLKARIGFATGKVLFYGTLGWASTDRYFAGPVTNDPISTSGISYGLGIDVMVNDRMFVGLEAQQRNLSNDRGDIGGSPNESFDYTVRTVGLRVGFKF